MKKVLITGLHGFISKHLALKYKTLGYEIMTVDREALGNPVSLKEILKNVDIDIILHVAAYGNHSNQKDENEIIATNILKTWFLLDATRDHDYRAFINFSSSSVYGVKDVPMSENSLLETSTLYGATKISGEFMSRYLALKENKPIVNVRPFSVYGEGEADHRFIPTVIRSIKSDTEFTLDPETNHDWVHVRDLVSGVDTVIRNAKKLKGQAVNIGTGTQYKNREVVDKIEWILEKSAKFKVDRNTRDYKPHDWIADTSTLNNLGWKPNIDLFSGLKELVKYYDIK